MGKGKLGSCQEDLQCTQPGSLDRFRANGQKKAILFLSNMFNINRNKIIKKQTVK